ncbi:hypothetical protein A2524_02570 [Candidatus Wolfebacteria bacterium RIFOXYD12_FULL_48_21]|nr:MAG: hypothetical protein A2524_02570 [Candidatus Wolfebacteria bacterium RIFOXYD12_FULL_48_21]
MYELCFGNKKEKYKTRGQQSGIAVFPCAIIGKRMGKVDIHGYMHKYTTNGTGGKGNIKNPRGFFMV